MIPTTTALIISSLYTMIILFYFMQSYQFHKNGIRTTAKIILLEKLEETDAEGNEERNNYATIEYYTEENVKRKARIRIGGKHKKEKYQNNLEIIYQKRTGQKTLIYGLYNLYKRPIDLLILFVILIVNLIMITKGLEVDILR